MPELIQIGVPTALAASTVYATPVRNCLGFINPTNANLQVNSTNHTSSGWSNIATTEGKFETAAPFIRTTETNSPIVTFKV